MTDPKVTFGFINCNRLFYLKACIESLLLCTQDYKNKELIIIDNASIEAGTEQYLDDLSARGFTVIRNKVRDPNNEFARGLSSFSSEEIVKIIGCHSNEIVKILGYISKSEVVHKDDMVKI